MSKKTPLPRLAWIGELALISDPNFTVDAVKVLKTYLRYLEDFPDTVFTQETAEAVACAPGVRGRPALRYVRETLGAFWRASLPPVLALPSPPEPPPKTPEEIAADHAAVDEILAGWRAFRAEVLAAAE